MASIRRTNSPAHRAWPQQSPFSSSPPQRLPSNLSSSSTSSTSSSSPSPPSFIFMFLRVISRTLFPTTSQPRKAGQLHQTPPWKRSLLRFLIFFAVGFVLGCSTPFGHHILGGTSSHSGGGAAGSDGSEEIRSPVLPSADVRRGNRVIDTLRRDGIASVELESKEEVGTGLEELAPRKLLIVVTPTHGNALQAYYLTRLGQTLRLVTPPLVWVVVEMGPPLPETAEVLERTGVMYRHLVCQHNCSTDAHLRNLALEHIERHNIDGIVYFADSENVYTLDLFEHIREVRRFGTWPVSTFATRGDTWILEGPLCNGSQVIGWYTKNKNRWLPRFYVDMSGFAFNSTILWDFKQWHRLSSAAIRHPDIVEGSMESAFTEQLVEDESQMESVPSGCSKIMNWHLQLDAAALDYPGGWKLLRNLEVVIPLS